MNGLPGLNLGFVTTASDRWPQELPTRRHREYSAWLATALPGINLVAAGGLIMDDAGAARTAAEFRTKAVDLVILLLGAFTGDAVAVALAEDLRVPVILWAPREPPFDGGRLMANSLVAATMNSAALRRMEFACHFVYGNPDEERVHSEILRYVRVYKTIKRLRGTYLGLLGYRPTGFYSSTFDEALIRRMFGVRMEELDLKTILDLAERVDAEQVAVEARQLTETVSLTDLPEGYLENHCRLYLALRQFVAEHGFNALSIKCWPELGVLKYTPCAVLSRFAEQGFTIGCESDVDATISMLVQSYLTGQTAFMGDLVSINERDNTAMFWHCGQAARSLGNPDDGVLMSNHPLAGQGVVFETTLKPGRVTVCRLAKLHAGYRLFLGGGKAVPTQKVVKGAMVNVVLDAPVLETAYRIAEEGIPHHYSIIWADVGEELRLFARILGIDLLEAGNG